MARENLRIILENHWKWLDNPNSGSQAYLSGADLRNAYLSGANLSSADLSGADLSYANLSYANLSSADLSGADLSYANLSNTHLNNTNLRGSNLSGANLSSADLSGAILIDNTVNSTTSFFHLQCPEEGSFIGWKKCCSNVLVKLLITEDAKRSSPTSRKCRASKVKVLDIIGAEEATSRYDDTFKYHIGDVLEVLDFDENRWEECSTGIHFFLTKQEAIDY